MPELPEVETVRRGLQPVLTGSVLTYVEQRRMDLRWPLPDRLAQRLTGRRVESLGRRSKWLLAALDNDETWMIHLGMSGRVLITLSPSPEDASPSPDSRGSEAVAGRVRAKDAMRSDPAIKQVVTGQAAAHQDQTCANQESGPSDASLPGRHDHLIITTNLGARITYNDPRRFGAMDLWPTPDLSSHPHLVRLGPEPLGNEFHAEALAMTLSGRRSSIKAALMDQRIVAGLGNIYVCEALYRAGIHPWRSAGRIAYRRIETLVLEIRATLADALEAGGSTLRDYRHADGELGYFQHEFRVYGREGQPCLHPGCSGMIQRKVQSGRSTFYCPRCQR